MGKIAIVTDSNSGITQAQAEELGVYVIPMPFYINEKMYLEGVTLYSSVKKALLELPILGTFLYNVRTHESNIRRTLQKTYFSRPQLVSSKMLDAYYEASHMGKSHGKYLMASIEGHYTDNAIGHAVKKLTIPLYIIESRSMTDAVAIADSYAHKNATVETAYISNAGLTPQLEVPDKLLNIMRMFLHEDH